MSPAADAARTLAVTGAGGWIGGRACDVARERGWTVRPLSRKESAVPSLAAALAGCGALVHCAGRAHADADAAEHERSHVDLSLRVAQAAQNAGVRRFVFVSSATVMGERSARPFLESDPPDPRGPYAAAKLRAERALLAMSAAREFEVVVARPPLVYGPGVRANFRALLRAALGPLPLPLADATMPRSMVHLDNLVDALLFLAATPGVAGRTFFVSDGHDATVAEVVRALRAAVGRRPALFRAPRWLWNAAAGIGVPGIEPARRRLFAPLQVCTNSIVALGWRPPLGWPDAIASTALWYAQRRVRGRA